MSRYLARHMLNYIYEHINDRPLVGVEIGVFEGDNAIHMLNHLDIKKLYLIDPYKHPKRESLKHIEAKQIAVERLQPYKDKIEFIYKKSENAIDNIPNNLDFVYIDGNHEYDYIKKDLKLYYPKVRSGGIFGGHDYNNNKLSSGRKYTLYVRHPDIRKAVDEFVLEHNLTLCNPDGHITCEDWWVVKDDNSS